MVLLPEAQLVAKVSCGGPRRPCSRPQTGPCATGRGRSKLPSTTWLMPKSTPTEISEIASSSVKSLLTIRNRRIFQNASRIAGSRRNGLENLALRLPGQALRDNWLAEAVHHPLVAGFEQRIIETFERRPARSLSLWTTNWKIPVSEHSIAVPQSSQSPCEACESPTEKQRAGYRDRQIDGAARVRCANCRDCRRNTRRDRIRHFGFLRRDGDQRRNVARRNPDSLQHIVIVDTPHDRPARPDSRSSDAAIPEGSRCGVQRKL